MQKLDLALAENEKQGRSTDTQGSKSKIDRSKGKQRMVISTNQVEFGGNKMGKKRAKELKKFVKEAISIGDAAVKEIKNLEEEVVFHMKQTRAAELKIKELEEACENFVEVEQNLHKKIAEMEQNKFLRFGKKITNLFG